MELGSLLIFLLLQRLRYLKCFNFPMKRGKVSNVESLKSKIYKYLYIKINVKKILANHSLLAPTPLLGNKMVLIPTDFAVNDLLCKSSSTKDRC